MELTYKTIVDIAEGVDNLYKRNYSNARQTDKVAQILNQAREAQANFVEIRKRYLEENAPNGISIDPQTDPDLFREAQKYMRSLLDDTVEIIGNPCVSFGDLEKFEKKNKAITACEMSALRALGILDDGEAAEG